MRGEDQEDFEEKQDEEGTCFYEHASQKHQKYGVFPLELRFGAHSTGLSFVSHQTTLNDVGSQECLLSGPARDPTKRYCTLHCIKVIQSKSQDRNRLNYPDLSS